MMKCRRRQTANPQKLKKLSTVVSRFLLAEAIDVEAEAVDNIVASTSLVETNSF